MCARAALLRGGAIATLFLAFLYLFGARHSRCPCACVSLFIACVSECAAVVGRRHGCCSWPLPHDPRAQTAETQFLRQQESTLAAAGVEGPDVDDLLAKLRDARALAAANVAEINEALEAVRECIADEGTEDG
jgi:hypothetical protein